MGWDPELQKDLEFRNQQFLISCPYDYALSGCPNYKPGQTSASENFICPSVTKKKGNFKFSVLGLISGTGINSGKANYTAGSNSKDVNIADYSTLVYSTILDFGGMGP